MPKIRVIRCIVFEFQKITLNFDVYIGALAFLRFHVISSISVVSFGVFVKFFLILCQQGAIAPLDRWFLGH